MYTGNKALKIVVAVVEVKNLSKLYFLNFI